jgi:hypothetical protein
LLQKAMQIAHSGNAVSGISLGLIGQHLLPISSIEADDA